jgi:putative ABC transport system substrate-binding protein
VQSEAARLGLALEPLALRNPPYDFAQAVTSLREHGADAALVLTSPVFFRQREALAKSLLNARLPSSFGLRQWAEDGGLMSYGASLVDMRRRTADYVDKIIKGAKAADLPVEQPSKFELVVNLKTAKAIGVLIPPLIIARADEIIE